jgi:hypothetical protein
MGVELEDIFDYAKERVKNKTVLQRVGHSGKLHMFRSAGSSPGSFASKGITLLGAAGRTALSAIPIPGLGSIIGTVEKCVQDFAKKKYRKRQLATAKAGKDDAEIVKFELKSLSIEELDRYRWKVEEAMRELNTALTNHQLNFIDRAGEGAVCDSFLALAMAAEQASRRIDKLREKCLAIRKTMDVTLDWLKLCQSGTHNGTGVAKSGVDGAKNQILDAMKHHVQKCLDMPEKELLVELPALHENCDPWCWAKDQATKDKFAVHKDRAAKLMKFLTAPFEVDSVLEIGMGGTIDKFKPSDIT